MESINIEQLINDSYPSFLKNKPKIIKKFILGVLKRTLHINEINTFIENNRDLEDIEFIDEVFEMLNFSFRISNKDIQKIPSEGRLICVANHPVGSLDSLSLIKAISEIRRDVKIVANDVLMNIQNLHNIFLPFNLEGRWAQRQNIIAIGEALEKEMAVIIFPAAEVSRLNWLNIRDGKWHKGAIYFAKKFNSPILPVYIDAKNSLFFYLFSMINKKLSRVLLSHELFNKKNKTININIGDPIPQVAFTNNFINDKYQAKLLKKHVYLIARNKNGIYKTEKNIIHPIDKQAIKRELREAQLLGATSDEKKIILTNSEESPNVLKEISRLREITFRKVGEGTGRKNDLDKFDKYYKHLVVWDENELEIVGSYRIGLGQDILKSEDRKGFTLPQYLIMKMSLSKNILTAALTSGEVLFKENIGTRMHSIIYGKGLEHS
ncbi:MAG: lysophospholipid acyltransferase family protein [Melioribacteraceae bacterium]|nr:lysophospholipid acyltransferase family protein [Melioribacteraceae bacterium]